jgi:hypothetical protein
MDEQVRSYLAAIGRRGGEKSRRVLSSEDARRMVRTREARRAYKRFYASCFWSYAPDLLIGSEDITWVAETLRRYGNRNAWETAHRLCP